MKLLADENVPAASVAVLQEAGYDVVAVSQLSPGVADRAVMDLAVAQGRIILTFDSDFGALIFREGIECPPGLVLLRFRPANPAEAGALIVRVLGAGEVDIMGQFTVLDRERLRQRPLPKRDV